MASWNEFFGTNNYNNNNSCAPEWMSLGSGSSVASQVIRYPARPYDSSYDGYYARYYDASSFEPPAMKMELNVPICCEGCEERVLSCLIDIYGVDSVKCDQLKQKVTVSGTASPAEVLAACKKLFKRSRWWPTY
ncbi:unnamed protein product [Calypogeia fissa]